MKFRCASKKKAGCDYDEACVVDTPFIPHGCVRSTIHIEWKEVDSTKFKCVSRVISGRPCEYACIVETPFIPHGCLFTCVAEEWETEGR